MANASALTARRTISPYARKLARARGIELGALRGSGPAGRIVAVDVEAFVRTPPGAPDVPVQTVAPVSALAATIGLRAARSTLEGFAGSGTAFDLEDLVLRAVGCALDDVPGVTELEGAPVALEVRPAQLVFDHIRRGSLAPLRARRLAAIAGNDDGSNQPAALSVRLLSEAAIRPVGMPLLPGRSLRLVLVAGPDAAEALLSFDAGQVDEDVAAALLSRVKMYLEAPLLLLA